MTGTQKLISGLVAAVVLLLVAVTFLATRNYRMETIMAQAETINKMMIDKGETNALLADVNWPPAHRQKLEKLGYRLPQVESTPPVAK